MVSNIDLEREKNIAKRKSNEFSSLNSKKAKILNSKSFSKYIQKMIKLYAAGYDNIRSPLFRTNLFKNLAIEKFNAMDLKCRAFSENGFIIFISRREAILL